MKTVWCVSEFANHPLTMHTYVSPSTSEKRTMNKRIIVGTVAVLMGFGLALAPLSEAVGPAPKKKAATKAKASKKAAPAKVPATKLPPTKAASASVAPKPATKGSPTAERTIPLGTPANLALGGFAGNWSFRIVSTPTNSAGRWPEDDPASAPDKAWFSVLVEGKNLNAKTERFPAIQIGFFRSDDRQENVNFLVTTNPFDAIPKCHDDGVGGAEVTAGATLQCQFFIETTTAEVPNIYAYISEDPDNDRKRFLLR
jgi:hypothetical protein